MRTTIYEARNNLSALVKSAEKGDVVELIRDDKPVAVIMNYTEYKSKSSKQEDWFSKLREKYADVLDDKGFDITPSRECPDYTKDPWA